MLLLASALATASWSLVTSALHPSPCRVAVKNIAYQADSSAVVRALSVFGEVTDVALHKVHRGRHHGRRHGGHGFVSFATPEDASRAAAAPGLRLCGRSLAVRLADVHHPGSQRKRTHAARRQANEIVAAPPAGADEAPDPALTARTQLLGQLRVAYDMAAVQACMQELGELRSADEYAIARAALRRAVVTKVETQQPVGADEYDAADFGI